MNTTDHAPAGGPPFELVALGGLALTGAILGVLARGTVMVLGPLLRKGADGITAADLGGDTP